MDLEIHKGKVYLEKREQPDLKGAMDLKSEFLRSLSLHDELQALEEESGNLMEAVNVAKLKDEILQEADMLGKAGKFMEASELILFYVLANSLWSSGGKGWPLKPFPHKTQLLTKALSFAKQDSSSSFYEKLAYTEAEILSNEHIDIVEIMDHLRSSCNYGSIKGEILCLRKLLDAHFLLNSSGYVWQDIVIVDSVETLFNCWNSWKDSIVKILECLPCLESQDAEQLSIYGQFALNYLGVHRQIGNANNVYYLLLPDANWVIKTGDGFLKRNGRPISIDVHLLVSAAQSYWCSELLLVGMNVLCNLEALYKFSVNKAISEFCQVRSLMLIYKVSNFLIESSFSHCCGDLKELEKFHRLSLDHFFSYVIPIDWKKSLTKNMLSLRETEDFQDLVKEVICENIRGKEKVTYGQIGRVAVMVLGTAIPKSELCVEIMRRFDDKPPWNEFIRCLHGDSSFKEMNSLVKFYQALKETCNANWMKKVDPISPSCFVYLIEHLVIMTSRWHGLIFASKSSFVEWLIYHDGNNSLMDWSFIYDDPEEVQNVQQFILNVFRKVLYNQNDTINWIRQSETNVTDYFRLLVLRLVVSICVLHLSFGSSNCSRLLNQLLDMSQITEQLPLEFCNVLKKGRKHLDLNVIAEAFKKVDNPLVIVKLRTKRILCPDAIMLDLKICQQREQVLQVLFPNSVETMPGETAVVKGEAFDSTSKVFPATNCSCLPYSSFAPATNQTSNSGLKYEMNVHCFWDMLEVLQLPIDASTLNRVLVVKEFLDTLLTSSIFGSLPQNLVNLEEKNEMGELDSLLDEMKQLSATLSGSDSVIENYIPVISKLSKQISVISKLSKQILSRRSKVEHILEQLFLLHKKNTKVDCEPLETSAAAGNDLEESDDDMSKNSQDAINSGLGNIRENTKEKKSKPKKNKGVKKKGRK